MVTAIGQHLNTLKDGMDSNWKFILTLGAFLTLLIVIGVAATLKALYSSHSTLRDKVKTHKEQALDRPTHLNLNIEPEHLNTPPRHQRTFKAEMV